MEFKESDIPDYVRKLLEKEKTIFQEQMNARQEKLKMQYVRVYHKLVVKNIPVKSTDTYNILLANALQEF